MQLHTICATYETLSRQTRPSTLYCFCHPQHFALEMVPYSRNSLHVRLARTAHTRGVYVRGSSKTVRRTGVVQSKTITSVAPPPIDENEAKHDTENLTVGLVHFFSNRQGEETIEASGEFPRKQDMALHEVTSQNVKHASTLILLRIQARDVRAQYERMWRCYANNRVQPFVYDSHEGNGDKDEKISNLCKYIIDHIKVIENYRILVDRCKISRSRFKRANRSGGYLTRLLRERNGAVVDELMARYEMTVGKVVQKLDGGTKCDAPADKSAVVHATSVPDATEGGDEPHVQQASGAEAQTTAVIVPAATPGVDANAQNDYNGLYTVQRMCTTVRNQRMLDMRETGIT